MSRLSRLSPAAIKAMFSTDTDDSLICLLSIYGSNIEGTIRIASDYIQRLQETDEEITYGLKSRGNDYTFVPFDISLPQEDESTTRARLTLYDPTRQLLPIVRQLSTNAIVKIELVLRSSPNIVEIDYGELLLANINYNAETITGDLTLESFDIEPFPSGTFTPNYFPGLF